MKEFINKFKVIVGLPILGVFLTIVTQQLFLKENKETEEKIKFKAEIAKIQIEHLNRLKRFQKLSSEITYVNVQPVYSDEKGNLIGEDIEGIGVN